VLSLWLYGDSPRP